MLTIEHDRLRVRVKELGAELCGIYSKEHDTEYMWQPGYEIWDHSCLTLFPNNGRIYKDRTVIGGRVYPATMQGFAKTQVFTVTENTGERAVLELRANDETRRYFPYEFTLRVSFSLAGDKLTVSFTAYNHGEEPMYFCLGMHPGFYLPLVLGEKTEDYVIRFDRRQNINRLVNEPATMLLTGERKPYLTDGTDIPLRDDLFNGGSHLLEGVDAESVTLLSTKSGRFVELGISGFPYMCLWGNAIRPYLVCIEPWCGTSDFIDTDHIWEKRPGALCAPAHGSEERSISFRVG